MHESIPCPVCQCAELNPAHKILALLADDDLDAALAHGLLEATACQACAPGCNARLIAARDDRHGALAARERHRARDARLARRRAVRDAARMPPPDATSNAPGLPAAAADALARALAKARGRKAP